MAKVQELAITAKKEENMSEWYTQVILKADLIEYTDVSGCMIFKPNSYQIWEAIQEFLNIKIKEMGVRNAYFPLLIPEKLLVKEEDHIEGFAAEVAWVTHSGNTKLKEKLAIRPTSETIMYDAYSKWIKSYRDLPLKMNQWCNIIRWEFKHSTPFLRNREFLWQEGHTVHETKEEAEQQVRDALDAYAATYEELLAIPVNRGLKSVGEKFDGADFTETIETFLVDGKAIQGATSHMLGQNFAKAFNIEYLDKNQKKQMPYQTSWGLSTRTIGAMIMVHSDNKGLVLPPRAATNKVVLLPMYFKGKEDLVNEQMSKLEPSLKKFGVIVDDYKKENTGFKISKWEMQGIPIQIEVGPRDVANGVVTFNVRDLDEKFEVKLAEIETRVQIELDKMHQRLYDNAKAKMDAVTKQVDNFEEFKSEIENKSRCLVAWAESKESEDEIKEQTGAKSSCKPFKLENKSLENIKCFYSGKPATCWVYFCKSH
ncbi:MAG: proline--tRNA ligase [Nanoarchaeales archaeon]|nr:proline--tRNA ligase [Nanoarchaeales archaeon]